MLHLWCQVHSFVARPDNSLHTSTYILWQRCVESSTVRSSRLGVGATVGRFAFTCYIYVWQCQNGHCMHFVNINTIGKFMLDVACISRWNFLVGEICRYGSWQIASYIFPFLSTSIPIHFCYLAFPYLLISTLSLVKKCWLPSSYQSMENCCTSTVYISTL